MKHFSTFSGVEGIGLGLPKDWKCVGFSEIDKHASMVLNYHYPKIKNYGDITKIKWNEIPDFDLLTGGSPCQDFSIAGKRRGLKGSKSSLAWEFIRGLRSKKPRYFLWENVKGVMSSRGGWDFANLITAFSESGYSLWWQILDAKDFGVPQQRERVFVIGFREGSPKEILFESKTDKESSSSISEKNIQERKKVRGDTIKYEDSESSVDAYIHANNWQNYIYDSSHRILTPVERERLMSWSDNWTKFGRTNEGDIVEISDLQRIKICGNGVVSNVVEEIVKRLIT